MSETETNGQIIEPTVEDRLKTLESRLLDVEARRREIEKSTDRVDTLAREAELRRLALKEAKDAWEGAVERHMELCRRWSKSEEVASRPLIKACEAKADPIPADNSWREEPIEVLEACGLGGDIVVILGDDNGLCTLGDLADWSRDHDGYNSIDRIGKAKAQQIEDAFSAYWDARTADVQDADDAEDEAEEETSLVIADDAYAALRAVGHTEEQARQMIERVNGKAFNSVNDMIDAIYAADPEPLATARRMIIEPDPERSGLDLVTSRPDSDPETNGVEGETAKPKRRRKAKA